MGKRFRVKKAATRRQAVAYVGASRRVRAGRKGRARPDAGRVHTPFQFTRPVPIEVRAGETVRTVADRQGFHLPFIAILNGKPILRAAWDHVLDATDRLILMTLPAGDGVKDVFRMVLQIALVAAASYFLGPAGLGLTGGWLMGATAVATVAAGYITNALLPPSTPDVPTYNSGPAASPTYSLQAQGNQARLGGQIPWLAGHHILNPDFAAEPYVEYVGNDLFLYQLFSIGLGQTHIHEIRIAKTTAWDDAGGYSESFSDIEFEFVPAGQQVTLFPPNVYTSDEVSGQTLDGPSDDGTYIGPYVAVPAGHEANFIAFDVVWAGGAGHVNDDGSISQRDTRLRMELRKIDDIGNPAGDWVVMEETTFSFATRDAQRRSFRYPVEAARYEGRMIRVNDAASESRDWDAVTWAGLRAYLVGPNAFPAQTIAMRARATNQLSQQASRQVTVIGTSMVPVLVDGEWSAPQVTRDIFPLVAYVLKHADLGGAMPDARIDLEKLASLHETWVARGDTFDGVFDSTQSVFDVVTDILRVGRSRPIEIGNSVTFVRDEKLTTPSLLLTPREITAKGFSVDYVFFDPTTPDDVVMEYVDERTWNMQAEVRATLPGSASKNPVRQTVKGITDRTRNWRFGMYLAAVNKYRREFPSAQVEYDGRILTPASLIPVSHPLCDWGRSADIVAFDADARSLKLSQRARLAAGASNYVLLRKRDGKPWGPVSVAAGESDWHVVMDEAEYAGMVAAQGDPADWIVTPDTAGAAQNMEPSVAVLGRGEDYQRDCKLVSLRYDGDQKMTLALVADDDRVYSADEGEPPAEPDTPSLPTTPSAPVITQVDVVVRGTRFAPELFASVPPAPGALSYIFELSYDHRSWEFLRDGSGTTWSGPVEATTVWVRVTPIGSVRGLPVEWFRDLTATEAAPAAVTGVHVETFVESAWVYFTPPNEDGIEGVIAKVSTEHGFDPETEGTVAYDDIVLGHITVDITAAATVYVRLACYNRFGKTGLNWSSELEISANFLGEMQLTETLRSKIAQIEGLVTAITEEQTTRQTQYEALASSIATISAVVDDNTAAIQAEQTARANAYSAIATSIETVQTTVDGHTTSIETISESVDGISARHTIKIDNNGYVVGTELLNGGPGLSSFTVVADKMNFVYPTVNGGAPFAMMTIDLYGVRINSANIRTLAVSELKVVWGEVDELVAGKIRSADSKMISDYGARYEQMDW